MLELILQFDRLRYSRKRLAAVFVVSAVVCLMVSDACAHELEDGFVERSVAVIVRPGEATISYSIGANEATRQQLVNRWCRHDQSVRDTTFLKAVGEALVGGLNVEVDGNPVGLKLVEVMPTPRHHVEATVVMKLELPSSAAGASSVLLKFHDRNFQTRRAAPDVSNSELETALPDSDGVSVELGGAFRYALKGANGAMLNRSTVAPILVRAKRRLVAEIPPEQLDVEQQFWAEVILP